MRTVHPASAGAVTLLILSGHPGVGKTTLARPLAERLGGLHVRAEVIEQALRGGGWDAGGE